MNAHYLLNKLEVFRLIQVKKLNATLFISPFLFLKVNHC